MPSTKRAASPCRSGVLEVLDELVEMGLDGIEVWTPENTEEQTQAFHDYAKKNNLLMTGGSDFHGLYSRAAHTIASYSTPDENLAALKTFQARQRRARRKAEAEAAKAAAGEE